MSYKLVQTPFEMMVVDLSKPEAFIPFAPDNTDYQQFKKDVADGVELQDPDGNVMTQEQVDEFLRTIP